MEENKRGKHHIIGEEKRFDRGRKVGRKGRV